MLLYKNRGKLCRMRGVVLRQAHLALGKSCAFATRIANRREEPKLLEALICLALTGIYRAVI